MITVLKKGARQEEIDQLINWFAGLGISVKKFDGKKQTVLGLVGNTDAVDMEMLKLLDMVEDVRKVEEPFKSASRDFHPENTIIEICDRKIGDGSCQVIAGPCSVESEEQILEVAKAVKEAGGTFLRGGAFKPRTSPYDFQGMKAEGIELLLEAKKATGLPIVTEIMNQDHLPLFEEVDIIQVGARNMQNFELLKELGRTKKTILLKRGLANTIKELLMSAEYIMAGGNDKIILCERGIRTFETYTRNTLDLSAVPVLKRLSHLPVVADPSHGTGHSYLVEPMAMATAACGADGIMIEVHNNPAKALCDGPQSLTPRDFSRLMKKIRLVKEAIDCE